LIVIDEYQLLYNEDAIKYAAGSLVTTILEKGRSYGISILFASQTVHIPNDALGNISTRIALRTDLGRQLLSSGNSKTLKLTIGHGIINSLNGDIDNDVLFRWYYLRDDEKLNLIKEIGSFPDAYNYNRKKWIFEGEAKAELQKLQLINNSKPESIEKLTFAPGEKLLIDDEDYLQPFEKLPNNNLLVVAGQNVDPSIRSLYGTLVSMLPQLYANNATIYLMNFITKNNHKQFDHITQLHEFMKNNKFKVKYIEDDAEIMDMLDEIVEFNNSNKDTEKPVSGVLVIFNAENSNSLEYNTDGSDYSEATKQLLNVLKDGNGSGFFTLLQCNSCVGCDKIFVIPDDLLFFQHRIALQMDYENSRTFVDNPNLASNFYKKEEEEATVNRCCYYNSQLQKSEKLKPFEFVDRDNLNKMFNNIIK
jgi:hypothetical protein